jgi:hypothetical protein
MDRLAAYFRTGMGRRWLDNAVIRIYRDHFTYRELKGLVRFYRSPAGRKMSAGFPVIMLQSLAAGQAVRDYFKPAGQ